MDSTLHTAFPVNDDQMEEEPLAAGTVLHNRSFILLLYDKVFMSFPVPSDHAGVCAGSDFVRGPQALQQEREVPSGTAGEDRAAGASNPRESLRSE